MGEESNSGGASGNRSLEERLDRLERLVEHLMERDARERREGPGAARTRTEPPRAGHPPGSEPRPSRGGASRPGAREQSPPRSHAHPHQGPGWREASAGADWAARGENWLGRVGIVFLVLALGFFLKYSFDQGWITPLLRVILGLLLGGGLLFLGLRLEGPRRRYSQLLLGGALAVFYIVGFAAYQLYELLPFFLAFSCMCATTVLAVVLAERQDHASLATVGLMGGLSTPFLVNSGSQNIAGLVLYTSLVLIGFGAVQFRRGWRTLLTVMALGGYPVLIGAALMTPDSARWITFWGILVAWALIGVTPILRHWLRAESPDRWPVPPLGWLEESLGATAEHVDGVLMRLFPVVASLLTAPLIAVVWHVGAWDGEFRWIGSLFLLLAAVYCLLAWGGRRVAGARDGSADTAALLLPLGLILLIQESWALLPLAVLATGYHMATREWGLRGVGIVGHLLFALLALWFLGELASQMDSSIATPLDLEAFALLGALVMAFSASLILPKEERPVVYQIAAHVAFLAWLGVEFGDLPGGTGLVTIAWGAYGIILLAISISTKNRLVQIAGLATLGLVAAKLLLVDMAQLDMIWRILLFMGFGAAFLALSYFINRPTSAAADSEG